jgi:hypothetical protein
VAPGASALIRPLPRAAFGINPTVDVSSSFFDLLVVDVAV